MTQTGTTAKDKISNQNFEAKVALILRKEYLRKDRDREVLTSRYGLNGKNPKTLESIGKKLGITRERVRQIEKAALAKLEKATEKIEGISGFHNELRLAIENSGGFLNEERLVSIFIDTKQQELKEINSFLFLVVLDKTLARSSENNENRAFWAMKKTNRQKLQTLSKQVDDILEQKRKVMSDAEIANITGEGKEVIESLMWVKKNVLQTDDKKWGLITWREVNPKSIRDKTYLIMKAHKKPLHYSNITEKILQHRLQKRPVTKQAVHNELIRDDRFVLIGRGIYALSEWGYKPGVVEDVIKQILKDNGAPMHKNEIIEHVKKHRIVKDTTIILNLQKNSFKRVSRATYTLAD